MSTKTMKQAPDMTTAPSRWQPLKILALGMVLTVVVVAVVGWHIWSTHRAIAHVVTEDLRIVELRGTILHYDEVLTMSARMAAATGDLQWEERYRRFEPALDAAIKEAIRLAPEAYKGNAAAQTDAANLELIRMENQAFALVRQGKREAASQILFSAEYEEQKQIYADGMGKLATDLGHHTQAHVERYRGQVFWVGMLGLGAAVLLVLGWVTAFATLRRHLEKRALAEEALRRAQTDLEARVQERTHELGKRVKELHCTYSIAQSIRQREDVREVFRDVVRLIPPGWHYPEITRARIRFDGEEYVSEAFADTEWKQSSVILVRGESRGVVEVFYLEARRELDEGPFLKEERNLIDGIARALSEATERKRTEQALRESEEKHRVITQAAQDAIIVADATGTIRFWNRAAETIFGYSAEEIVGRNMIDTIVPPQYHQAKRKGFAEFAKTGRGAAIGKTLELTALRKGGTEFPIEISLSGYRGRDGFVAVAVVRDVTDRKRAEEGLRRLAMIAEQAGEGIGVADLDGTLQFVNAAWAEMHGFQTRDELVGKHLSVFHTDEQMKTDVIPFNEEVKRSGYHTGQVGHVRRDGSQFPTEMTTTLLKDAEGEPIGLIGFVEDITERKRAEQAIREERDRAQSYLDIAGTMIALVDPSERITLINQKGCEILGYQREELLGQNWFNLLVPQRIRAEVRGVFQKLMAGHIAPVEYCENPLLTRDGEERLTAFHNTVLTEPSGRITAVLLSAEDITERKNAEERLRESNAVMIRALEREKRISASLEATMEQLERAQQDAEVATQAKSAFLANMSHEIRTPMTVILGFTDVLLEQGSLEKAPLERIEAAEAIRRNGEYLLGLINDILDLSKIEAGKFTVERLTCSPCRIVAEVASFMRVRSDAKGLRFDIEYEGAIPETIQTDPTRLRQILINALGNAVKFTEVGSVRLITRFVDADGGQATVEFDVVDTGLGMTEEQVAGLFQPFTQADASTTRKFGGTGLGLTISKRLAERLGGDIRVVDTKPAVGTRFRVSVPTGPLDGVKMLDDPLSAAVLIPDATTATSDGDRPALEGCQILLAEDGPDNQRLIVHMLKKAGAQVTVVENGSLVVDVALAARNDVKPFDVVLMDIQMPVMDGYRATRLLRQKGYTAPIVALTAHAMASDREKCIQAGCNDYTAKPINRKKLIETIRKHLPAAVVS